MSGIRENVEKINSIMNNAAEKAGIGRDGVTLCAVTKTRSAAEINEAIKAGVTDIGENKVQEILDKFDHVDSVRWHMIGHLQTNKVKYIIDKVGLIHSVDSIHLAEEIDKRAAQCGKVMDILLQVNPAMEESKFGAAPEDTDGLLNSILEKCGNIRIRGLMCMTPYEDDPEDTAVYYAQVKALYDRYKKEIKHRRLEFTTLSMGMSHDFEIAIKEGSNMIRVGTAIFGVRNYSKTGG